MECDDSNIEAYERATTVYLRYPNARLHVHDLLSTSKKTGAEAIASAACDYGLIKQENASRLEASKQDSQCECMATCKNILDSYLAERHARSQLSKVFTADLFSAIQYEAKMYEQLHNGGKTGSKHDCARFAPTVFDLMLQQIHKYE